MLYLYSHSTEHASAKLTCGEALSKCADSDGCSGESKVGRKGLDLCGV